MLILSRSHLFYLPTHYLNLTPFYFCVLHGHSFYLLMLYLHQQIAEIIMYTIYLWFKLYIFIPNNIRKHKSFLGKIIHSWLRKSLKKLVKHSFSKLFGKSCALMNFREMIILSTNIWRASWSAWYATGTRIMMSIRHLNDHECCLSHLILLIPLQEDQHNQKQEIIPVQLTMVHVKKSLNVLVTTTKEVNLGP